MKLMDEPQTRPKARPLLVHCVRRTSDIECLPLPLPAAMAMLRNVFIKVGVLLKQLEAEKKVHVPDRLITSRALLPDVMAAKRARADLGDEEIGGGLETLREGVTNSFICGPSCCMLQRCSQGWFG